MVSMPTEPDINTNKNDEQQKEDEPQKLPSKQRTLAGKAAGSRVQNRTSTKKDKENNGGMMIRPIAIRTDAYVSVQEFKRNVYNLNSDLARNSLVVYQDAEEAAGTTTKLQEDIAPSTQKQSTKKKAELILREH